MSTGRPQSHVLSLGVHDPQDAINGSYYVAADKVDCDSTRSQAEDVYLAKNRRLKEKDTGGKALNGLSSKRKQMLEDVSLLKKLKINETESDLKSALGKKRKDGKSAPPLPLTTIQRVHINRLVEKYGDNYERMFMDSKLNAMQHFVATLEKLCIRYNMYGNMRNPLILTKN